MENAVEIQTDTLDADWVMLMQEARVLGLSIEEVREFICKGSEE